MKNCKNVVFVLAALASVSLTTGCGSPAVDPEESKESAVRRPHITQQNRFSEDELRQIVVEGDTHIQSEFLVHKFKEAEASAEFRSEWGSFSHGVIIKAYFNTRDSGALQNSRSSKILVSSLESLSLWTQIRDEQQTTLLKDAYSIDSTGKRCDDSSDGLISAPEERLTGRIVMDMSPVSPSTDILVKLANNNQPGRVFGEIENTTAVSVFPFGQILPVRGIRMKLEVQPYRDGWLYYGAAAMQLQKVPSRAATMTDIPKHVSRWLKQRVLTPSSLRTAHL